MTTRTPWREETSQDVWGERLRRRLGWLESPLATYYLLLGSTSVLVVLGLVMVLSASSVQSYMRGGSVFSQFTNQLMFAVIGLVAAAVFSRLPTPFLKKVAGIFFLLAAAMQAAVMIPGVGVEVLGNRNWLQVGGLRIQPSEIGKIAMILVVAVILDNRRAQLYDFKKSVLPTFWFAGLLGGLVMVGRDLGTTMVFAVIYLGMLWAAGAKGSWFAWLGLGIAVLLPVAVMTSGNRTSRIGAWLGGCDAPSDIDVAACYQKIHGSWALADGGLWGLGPGASREKWGWLPEAHNDFIFAIIGEELGLPGTLAVLALYLVFAYACYRLIAQSTDMFVRVATAGIMMWICFQAVVNIGSVLGLLPIVGVPLPLVSAGGSALVMTLVGIGILLSFARREPRAAEALRAKPRLVRRTMAVLPNRKGRS